MNIIYSIYYYIIAYVYLNGREGGVGVYTALKFPAETFDYIYFLMMF
jgi:hypothetical protein